MSVLAVLNQKGGPGKSTVCQCIAVELARRGKSVLIVDTDAKQGTVSKWRALRHADDVVVVKMEHPGSLVADVAKHAKHYDVVIIDGVPLVDAMTAVSVKAADAVIIPVTPNPKDLWGTEDVVDLIHSRHAVTDGKPLAAFLANKVKPNTVLSRSVDDKLLAMSLPVFDTKLHNRELYAQCDETGQTVMEIAPTSEASKEVKALVDELLENNFVRTP